jgi:hypothetical protein
MGAGRPRDRSSSPGKAMNFNFSITSRPAPGVKRERRESDHSLATSVKINCPISFDTTRTTENPFKEQTGFISLQKIRQENDCIIQTKTNSVA